MEQQPTPAADSDLDATSPSTVEPADDEETDFFADLVLGRDGLTEGVITHW